MNAFKKKYTTAEVIDELRRFADKLGSHEKAGEILGISRAYVTHILSGHRPITEMVALKLGFKPLAQSWIKPTIQN